MPKRKRFKGTPIAPGMLSKYKRAPESGELVPIKASWTAYAYDPSGADKGKPVRETTLAQERALEIGREYPSRTYLVSNHVKGAAMPLGKPPAYSLIAYGALPEDALILSYDHPKPAEREIDDLVACGCTLLARDIELGEPSIINTGELGSSNQGSLFAIEDTDRSVARLEYAGPIPQSVQDWTASRFFASLILNCCFIGRGCPVGFDVRKHVDALAQNPDLMRGLFDKITFGASELPEIDVPANLPRWREDMLWESRGFLSFSHAFTRDENFRESFSIAPFTYQDPGLHRFVRMGRNLRFALIESLYEYEHGKDNTIEDVKYDDPKAPEKIEETFVELGMEAVVEAIVKDIPIGDLFVNPHSEKPVT